MKARAEEQADPLIGKTISGKFRVDARVGTGSMGAVYRARQLALNKTVAIKVMNKECAAKKAFASRFKREAKAASRLDHPNSLRVIDFGEDAGILYIAMEYVDGRDLLTMMKEDWPIETERIVDILGQALAALAIAHEMGIVHRDMKPENIMLLRGKNDEGRDTEIVKVCDFGIAKFLEVDPASDEGEEVTQTVTATGTLTANGMLIGTPEYMSPEQVSGEELDARSDLYSLGVILFQMLTGRLPFEQRSPLKMALAHVQEQPATPSDLVPEVDKWLEAVCVKALKKSPNERYQTAREMRADLRAAIGIKDSQQWRASYAPTSRASSSKTHRVEPRRTPDEELALSSAATLLAPMTPESHEPNVPRESRDEDASSKLTSSQRAKQVGFALLALAFAAGVLAMLSR